MRARRSVPWPATLALLLPAHALAGEPASVEPVPEKAWSFGASLSWYFVPDQKNFGVVSATADHGPLHLEARYNYEALRTASAFIGWNLAFGDAVKLDLTPLVGCMVGDAGGPILGFEVSLGWGPITFSSEEELVWDLRAGTGGYFYAWDELDVRPWHWLRAGIVAERTRVFHTAREVIFGPLLGVAVWKLDLTLYWFEPGGIDQTIAVALGMSF